MSLAVVLLAASFGLEAGFSQAQTQTQTHTQTQDEEPELFRMAVGAYRPPYVMADQKSGLEIDLIHSLFKRMQRPVALVPLPNSRAVKALTHGRVDGVSIFTGGSADHLHFSEALITFQNVALTRVSQEPKADSFEALSALRVVAFQNACKVLGEKFKTYCAQSSAYQEVPDQRTHLPMLWNGRIDVVIGEIRVLDYFQHHFQQAALREGHSEPSLEASQLLAYKLFPATHYRSAFRDSAVRDAFNRALSQMKADGSYQALLDRYQVNLPVVSLQSGKAQHLQRWPLPGRDLAHRLMPRVFGSDLMASN